MRAPERQNWWVADVIIAGGKSDNVVTLTGSAEDFVELLQVCSDLLDHNIIDQFRVYQSRSWSSNGKDSPGNVVATQVLIDALSLRKRSQSETVHVVGRPDAVAFSS